MDNAMLTRATRSRLALVMTLAWLAVPAHAQVVEYYHTDAIGNIRVIPDAARNVLECHDCLPFGEECTTGPCASNPQAAQGEPKKFTGKERDAETGLDYFGGRYYGSKIGRFTTVDPYLDHKDALLNPQKWNRYAYGRNNPLRYVDPDGRDDRGAMKTVPPRSRERHEDRAASIRMSIHPLAAQRAAQVLEFAQFHRATIAVPEGSSGGRLKGCLTVPRYALRPRTSSPEALSGQSRHVHRLVWWVKP